MNGHLVRHCKTIFVVPQLLPADFRAVLRISITSALSIIQAFALSAGTPRPNDKAVLTDLRPALNRTFNIETPKTLYLRAVALEDGMGRPRDQEQAVKLYREAAEQNYVPAEYDLALLYEEGRGVTQNFAEAAKWYRAAAEQGDSSAQNNLGRLYALGSGVPGDAEEAAQWYRKAADQGNREAQNNLANFYREGRGVGKDLTKALELYRLAAMNGYAAAQNNLGLMYANGRGGKLDYCRAYAWLSLAAKELPSSEKLLEQVRTKMRPEEVLRAQKLTSELQTQLSSEAGAPEK